MNLRRNSYSGFCTKRSDHILRVCMYQVHVLSMYIWKVVYRQQLFFNHNRKQHHFESNKIDIILFLNLQHYKYSVIYDVFIKAGIRNKGERKRKESTTMVIWERSNTTTSTEKTMKYSTFATALSRYELSNEAYIWSSGNIICQCCNSTIKTARKMPQHFLVTSYMNLTTYE